MSFNLTQEPWIPVVQQDWQSKKVSLIELFETWKDLWEIQADNPPTTLALYRFLLALLHHVYQGPKDEDHWEEIQDDNGKKAIAYLKEKQDCFDLLHPDRPFMQDPTLTEDKAVSVHAIHTMSTSKVFSHEHEWSGYSISLSQAAQLLVRLQTVDITSLRAFYPPQTTGNRSAVNTPTINAATILLQGDSLKETLLKNLMQYDPEAEIPSVVSGEDLPTWETSYAGQPQKAIPNGYINYLAYPWRRLRLFFQEDSVHQIAITMGNSLPDGISIKQWECHIAFDDGRPIRFSMEQQLWRDSHCFLHTAEKKNRPRIVDWLADLRSEKLVDPIICFQVFGMCADKAKPLGWNIDQFSAPILYATDKQLGAALRNAVDIAKEHQQVFRSFRGSPYHALSEVLKNSDAGNLARSLDGESRYWATLDRAFQPLLNELAEDKTVDGNGTTYGNQELPKWQQTVQSAAREAFTESIASIRNYQARAAALRSLEYQLAKLRGEKDEKAGKGKKASKKPQPQAS
ncbi:MAG: type I-E CRISPR-associated protein Cse1/CasA [Leptolyngbyaceae cyanobacterium RU_5_1]|nr:type I-E CRISPR-associated protein Cse1/CasA [Leptolyngbyaceae cyanobacterium RU_5_1]